MVYRGILFSLCSWAFFLLGFLTFVVYGFISYYFRNFDLLKWGIHSYSEWNLLPRKNPSVRRFKISISRHLPPKIVHGQK